MNGCSLCKSIVVTFTVSKTALVFAVSNENQSANMCTLNAMSNGPVSTPSSHVQMYDRAERQISFSQISRTKS